MWSCVKDGIPWAPARYCSLRLCNTLTSYPVQVHDLVEGVQMGSSRRDRDIAKLRKNSQNVNRQIWLHNFA